MACVADCISDDRDFKPLFYRLSVGPEIQDFHCRRHNAPANRWHSPAGFTARPANAADGCPIERPTGETIFAYTQRLSLANRDEHGIVTSDYDSPFTDSTAMMVLPSF
jgi:hypothetical protein